jgi:hypothetical protein
VVFEFFRGERAAQLLNEASQGFLNRSWCGHFTNFFNAAYNSGLPPRLLHMKDWSGADEVENTDGM